MTGQVVNIKMPVLTDKYLNLSRITNFSADRENKKALIKEEIIEKHGEKST